ncbi:DUF721 domain-containing protein [Aidingimonas lacisalsi]|uniref:DUF721 domain-containing protein n=1 Tax=Aidingimonas lacisalsi TaxID=2604086 RepID=UPI0011D25577|nr:DciA family protein [Aidingimonas lacisalsi]
MSIKVKRFRAQPVNSLLAGQGDLGHLMRTATLIERAQNELRQVLPEEMREHVFVGGYRQGKLTVITDQAAWLTWLRFQQTQLLTVLHRMPELESVLGLNFKVRPIHPPKPPQRQVRRLPTAAADELSSCAADTENPRLKRSLERLASHAERHR